MKTFLTRTLPLLLCIAFGTAASWVSIYVFWFAIWTFHSVPAARACDAVGAWILFPARWISEWMGGDQSSVFFNPTSFAGTNGLVWGIMFYCVFRAIWNRHEARVAARGLSRELEPEKNSGMPHRANGSAPLGDARLR